MSHKRSQAKIQRSSAKRTFSNLGLNEGGRKNVRFSTDNWYISETVRDTAKVTIDH